MAQQEPWHPSFSQGPKRPQVTRYDRLVRDRIPDMIESMGNIALCRDLDDETFAQALLATLVRASQQFAESESLETMADMLDAVDAWLEVKGLSMDEVEHAREERRKRCGGFDRRRFLEVVADGDAGDVWTAHGAHC
ncbi:nucleoside triphosphate pyrophosphohydrolase [Alicyclobacillus sp. ALC3]|uniref:nucleoside triphosphate pyrophosphohydrolase n=1 Tax=Alicyclobacillus sp. ALC3 TaxID=2796143 RepID=UPI002378D2AE|nr:nucleoside triphosphate pyrophosphohydrolase [Alicyclobacillus sp. ALC3]WDL96872.1 nucleoside triphosphate pyrophosphohydrolase [Alicyclobacillus sp. ALC3]